MLANTSSASQSAACCFLCAAVDRYLHIDHECNDNDNSSNPPGQSSTSFAQQHLLHPSASRDSGSACSTGTLMRTPSECGLALSPSPSSVFEHDGEDDANTKDSGLGTEDAPEAATSFEHLHNTSNQGDGDSDFEMDMDMVEAPPVRRRAHFSVGSKDSTATVSADSLSLLLSKPILAVRDYHTEPSKQQTRTVAQSTTPRRRPLAHLNLPSQPELDQHRPLRKLSAPVGFGKTRSSLTLSKRKRQPLPSPDQENQPILFGKRLKNACDSPLAELDGSFTKPAALGRPKQDRPELQRCFSEADVGRAKNNYDQHDLIGDYSKPHSLALVEQPRVPDLKNISCHTLASVLRNEHATVKPSDVLLVDCRFPYEFEGGHVPGAVNCYEQPNIWQVLQQCWRQQRILLFYCEFSQERGPRMARAVRKLDRAHNKTDYPRLHYPEIYLLDGGYKKFFEQCRAVLPALTYVPMLDKSKADECRMFRAKCKSWAGDVAASVWATEKYERVTKRSGVRPRRTTRELFKCPDALAPSPLSCV